MPANKDCFLYIIIIIFLFTIFVCLTWRLLVKQRIRLICVFFSIFFYIAIKKFNSGYYKIKIDTIRHKKKLWEGEGGTSLSYKYFITYHINNNNNKLTYNLLMRCVVNYESISRKTTYYNGNIWNWLLIYPTSHHYELLLYRRKENIFI